MNQERIEKSERAGVAPRRVVPKLRTRPAYLSQADHPIREALRYERALAAVARLAVPSLADWCIVDVLRRSGVLVRGEVVCAEGIAAPETVDEVRHAAVGRDRDGPVARVLRSMQPEFAPDLPPVLRDAVASDYGSADTFGRLGMRSLMVVPVLVHRQAVGTVTFLSTTSGRRFGPAHLAFAWDLVGRAADAADVARAYAIECDARTTAEESARLAAFVASASRLLAESIDEEATLTLVSRVAIPVLADCCVLERERPGAEGPDVLVAHVAPEGEADVLRRYRRFGPSLGADPSAPHAGAASDDALVPHSTLVLPLVARGRTVGRLSLGATAPWRRYGVHERASAEELAHHAALALDNAQRFAAEHHAREHAERAVRSRDDLLAIVSHDLRSPLSTIFTASTLLSDLGVVVGERSERALKAAEVIRRSAERMKLLIRDLLDVASIESGRLSVHLRPQAVRSLLEDTLEMVQPFGRSIDYAVGEECPEVSCDRERVLQVFANLLGNAIKFSGEAGSVTIRGEPRAGAVEFQVADDGPGIPPEDLPRVFDRFWQGNRFGREGSGLGLYISRAIVCAHGGDIWVESKVGEGAKFFFTLPTAS